MAAALLLCCCSCINVQQDIALGTGATQAARGFKPEAERRMIYTYVGRIYESVEDYPRAIEYFQRKLDEYPKDPSSSQRAVVSSEKSVILNQMGAYAYRMGKFESALRYYRESLRLAVELEVVHGEVVNSANIGQVALRIVAGPGRGRKAGASRLLAEAYKAQGRALKRIHATPEYPRGEYALTLRSNMAALAQQAAALGVVLPVSG